MRTFRKLVVVLLALVATGLARLPFDQRFAEDLRDRHLLLPPIDFDTRQSLGQTTYAIALGGLRSLIAALLNIRAHVHFEYQEWTELEKLYKTITTLQPHTSYYWQAAAHHLAYNAYSDYADKPDIPDARRRYLQREFLARGIRFYKDGIANNPDDWRLRQSYIRTLIDPFKPNDFPAALEQIREAIARGQVPDFFHREELYVLCRIPGRGEEAWELAKELWQEEENRRIPSVREIYFSLQWRYLPPDQRLSIEEIFGTRREALKYLSLHWMRRQQGYPMDGVRETIEQLLAEFRIPQEFSPFRAGPWKGYPPELFQSP